MLIGGVAALAVAPRDAFAQVHPASLDEIVARHVRARGGAAALDRVRSCQIELDITEGG